jgi:hypothetical protein
MHKAQMLTQINSILMIMYLNSQMKTQNYQKLK